MRTRLFVFALLLTGLLPLSSFAQYHLTADELRAVPTLPLPPQDNAALLTKELAARKPGRPISFAVALPTTVRPSTHGVWSELGSASVWQLRIKSLGAKTLNLGFSEFNLPPGANLYLLTPEKRYGPFTRADNEVHNQLWTPIMEGDELLVELRVPTRFKKRVQLYLTSVNHDFQGITKSVSGSCNLDVICGAEDGWSIVDGYRDIIRSVAAYTLNGTDACTGFLVNNVNGDGLPLFMTADHCGVRANNAPSLVAYWNFESDVCRQPGSSESGQLGFGTRNLFNAGTSLLATWPESDVTLTLFDDPVNPEANVYFAGWDANLALPADTTVGVHHPGVDEKRISFSFNQTDRSSRGGSPDAEGNYLRVPDWSIGTTEGGSSGSPIFDADGYIRGQLFGGRAACGNDLFDTYGYFPVSWEGGGTPETRLKDWLDPCGTGRLKIDGMEYADVAFALRANGNCATFCAGVPAKVEITAGDGYPAGTDVSILSTSPGLEASLSVSEVGGGESFDLVVESPVDLPDGTYAVVVRAVSPEGADDIELLFNLTGGLADAPLELTPADNETDVNSFAFLSWEAVEDVLSYDLQLSTFADFSFVTYSAITLAETELSLPSVLEPNTTYFWRVRSGNACGVGEWATYSFSTDNLSCSPEFSADTPVTISSSGMPTVTSSLNSNNTTIIAGMEVTVAIDHSYIGDLTGTLTSPSGTTIQLFDPVLDGNCSGANMAVTFSDEATQNHADFTGACTTGEVSVTGIYQPAESFSAFNGENPQGAWTLTISDEADFDGGQIVGWRVDFCGVATTNSLSAQSEVTSLEVCSNSSTSFNLLLGDGFDSSVFVDASVDGDPLSGVVGVYNETNNLLLVTINSWSGVPLGNSELTLEVSDVAGAVRLVTLPLLVTRPSVPAELSSPANTAMVPEVDIEFEWQPVVNATSYVLQYSLVEDFAELLGSVELVSTSALVENLPGGQVFWRVITISDCGALVSEVNAFTITTNSTQNFGQGREISVYPNPVQEWLTVAATGNWPGVIRAGLYDASGRFITEYHIDGAGRTTWNLGGLAAGVYYLRFSSAGQQRTERLVVLR